MENISLAIRFDYSENRNNPGTKQIRNLLAGGENFVNGGLVALGVRMEMDLVLKATGQMKMPAFLLSGFEDVSVRAPEVVKNALGTTLSTKKMPDVIYATV